MSSGNDPSPPPRATACAARVVAEIAADVTWLTDDATGVYGATAQGAVFHVVPSADGGPGEVKTIASGEEQPAWVVVRDGRPAWGSESFAQLVGANADGSGRRILAQGAQSVAAGPGGLYFAGPRGLWTVDWPRATTPRLVAPIDASAYELVVAEPWIVGASATRGVWAYDLDTQAMRDIPQCPDGMCQRKPCNLTLGADGFTVAWHEGPAELLPGKSARAFAFSLRSWQLTKLAGNDGEAGANFVLDGACQLAAGGVKGSDQERWSEVTPGEPVSALEPVASGATEWVWVHGVDPTHARILAGPKGPCCEQALRAARR